MTSLKIVEKNDQRVLTSAQLAEVYGTDYKSISKNYARNKDRYIDGKHYFLLKGEERSDFLDNYRQNDDSLKHAKHIFLWTDKGALLHAKSLGTDPAWDAYTKLVDDYFKKVEELKQAQPDITGLSPQLQFMIMMEQKHNALEAKQQQLEEKVKGMDDVKEAVETITDNMTAAPNHTKVVSTVNEYARWTRLGHNEVYNKVYDMLKSAHGIDVKQRVENERAKIQDDYNKKTGKWYSESTLKSKVNGIDVMVRIDCLDKFNSILVGLLAKEKAKSNLRLVQ